MNSGRGTQPAASIPARSSERPQESNIGPEDINFHPRNYTGVVGRPLLGTDRPEWADVSPAPDGDRLLRSGLDWVQDLPVCAHRAGVLCLRRWVDA